MKNTKIMTKVEILAEANAIQKEITALKKELLKIKAKAKTTAAKAQKLGVELEQSGKYDTKQKWIGKIIDNLSFWQDASYDIDLVLKTW